MFNEDTNFHMLSLLQAGIDADNRNYSFYYFEKLMKLVKFKIYLFKVRGRVNIKLQN